jgi:hypothetical protein
MTPAGPSFTISTPPRKTTIANEDTKKSKIKSLFNYKNWKFYFYQSNKKHYINLKTKELQIAVFCFSPV